MLLADIYCFKNPKFGAANIISMWIKFPLPVLIRKYDTFEGDIWNFIKLNIIIKCIIFAKKWRLEVDPVLDILWKCF